MIKTVLITGSARRIGAGIAKALANEGWHVCVHFNQSAHDAATVVSDIKAAGGIASAIQANLEEPAAASQLVEQCNKVSGPLPVSSITHQYLNMMGSKIYQLMVLIGTIQSIYARPCS